MKDPQVAKTHVRLRLEAIYNSLTPAEQRVCDYVLRHSEDLIHMKISELAHAVGVSDATVTRLCQSVGYRGYPEFRVLLARDIAVLPAEAKGELKVTDEAEDIRDKLIAGSVQSLQDTRNVLNIEALRRGAALIAQADRVDLYSIGGSASVALDMQHKLLKLGIPVSAHSDVDHMSICSATLSSRDLAVGISHTSRSEPVVAAIERAKTGGAGTIALTHDPLSPVARASDIVLHYAAKRTTFSSDSLSGRLAQLIISDMLYTIIAYSDFERSAPLLDRADLLANARRLP
jgi:RpiR family carbohydrate utilization transcriptional regulator